jgi:hypothetical protein
MAPRLRALSADESCAPASERDAPRPIRAAPEASISPRSCSRSSRTSSAAAASRARAAASAVSESPRRAHAAAAAPAPRARHLREGRGVSD